MYMQPIFLNSNLAIFARNLLIWLKQGQKTGFFAPDKLANHTSEGKERRKEMNEEEEFKNGGTLSFLLAYLEINSN